MDGHDSGEASLAAVIPAFLGPLPASTARLQDVGKGVGAGSFIRSPEAPQRPRRSPLSSPLVNLWFSSRNHFHALTALPAARQFWSHYDYRPRASEQPSVTSNVTTRPNSARMLPSASDS